MNEIIDLLNQSILEHRVELMSFDIENFQSASTSMMEGSILPSPTIVSPEMYCKYIDKTITYLNTASADTETLDTFFTKIHDSVYIDDKNISIYVQPYENIEKIRPEYLANVPLEFEATMKKIISGDFKESDIRKKYVSGEFYEKTKKQLVKTTLSTNNVKDLMVLDSPAVVKIDETYIVNNIIPFIRGYRQSVKELVVIAMNAKGRINNSYGDIKVLLNTLETLVANGKVSPNVARTLNYFKYNAMRQYMNLCAYLTAMIIRKSKYYFYNMMSYTNLYNTFLNYFPDGENVLHESVEGDDIDDLDDSTILTSMLNRDMNVAIPYIDSTINKKKMQMANIISRKFNYRVNYTDDVDTTKYPYDTYPYAAVNKSFMDIMNNLHIFEVNMKDPNAIVDDVLAKSNLDDSFVSRYSNILISLDNVEYYTSQKNTNINNDGSVSMAIFSDICSFKKNLSIISSNAGKVNKYIEELKDSLEFNHHDLDDTSFSEYQDIIEKTWKNYREYALAVAKKLLSRFDELNDLVEDEDIIPSADPEEFVPFDYDLESYREAYEELDIYQSVVFESMLNDYHKLRIRKETGAILEDVEEADTKGTAPTVQTDAQIQHKENQDKSTPQKADTKVTKSLVETFKKWVNDILDKFRDKSRGLTAKNNRWLQTVKADLNNLDTSNTTINIAKYENATSEKILAEISSASNKINTLNPSNLPQDLKSRDGAARYIFPDIPAKIGNETTLNGRIRQYMTFGNTDKTTLTAYSGDDAKTKIANMITFCEQYEDMYNRISNELDKLKDAAAKKQQDIINTLGTHAQASRTTTANNDVTEAVLFEAETQNVQQNGTNTGNDKDTKDKITSSSVITTVAREYMGAILTIIEKKYLDYIKVLSKLAPKKNAEQPQPESNAENKNESVEVENGPEIDEKAIEERMNLIVESSAEFNIDDLL